MNTKVRDSKKSEWLMGRILFIRLRAENHGCKPVDECRKVHYGEMSPQHVGGGPRRPLALPRGRRETAAGFSGTTAVKPWGSILLIITIIIYYFPPTLLSNDYQTRTFNVGLKLIDFEYAYSDGKKETVTAAIWYPTEEKPKPYTYVNSNSRKGSYESKVALDAPMTKKGAPYPLILFAHGGYGSGCNSAFFMEYLASHGYIMVAPDYVDTTPPDYKEQIAFSRTKKGNVGQPLQVLKIVGQFVKDMNGDRDLFLSYLTEHRLNHTSFIIDKIMELNKDPNSIFYQTVKEDVIGISGHSLGGVTILGKIGAHPDKKFKDNRIKAALIFSGGVYPFENNIGNIDIPMMAMAGDDDEPMTPTVPRRVLYDVANTPKFYLILKNSTHFSFGNGVCAGIPLYEAVETNPQANAICRYGLAFFEKYLRGNLSAGEQLDKTDPAWVYYIKEETKGESLEWGEEPPLGEGGPGGIRSKLGGGRGRESKGRRGRGEWLRRWRDRAVE